MTVTVRPTGWRRIPPETRGQARARPGRCQHVTSTLSVIFARTCAGGMLVRCGTYGAPWLSAVTRSGRSYDAP
jgi:hypothetical protein